MNTLTLHPADLHVKTLEYLVDLWDKGLLPEDMQEYVMEEVPILKLLYKNRQVSADLCTHEEQDHSHS